MSSSSSIKPFLNQDYESIKRNCIQNKRLFEDEKFPADKSSLYKKNPTRSGIKWKRPFEICKNPQFIVNSIMPSDLDQGEIGDCWLISSCSALVSQPNLLEHVIPVNQTFNKPDYCGIFHFKFWRGGAWYDIVVDDQLPCSSNGDLIYCHNSVDKNEMFGPLLEKAFAKFYGCYEFLDGGNVIDALIDMTGGVHEEYKIKNDGKDKDGYLNTDLKNLWEILYRSYQMKSLMGTSAFKKSGTGEQSNGIIQAHAYTILEVYEIFNRNGQFNTVRNGLLEKSENGSLKLIKARNPWGKENSWKGRFCSNSNDWQMVGEQAKSLIKYNDQLDGEFFMSYEDYSSNFDKLTFIHVNINAMSSFVNDSNVKFNWEYKEFYGEWIPGQSAGGCQLPEYDTNPQFVLPLQLKNKIDDKVSIIISLIQIPQEQNTTHEQYEAISFRLHKVKDGGVANPNNALYPYDKQLLYQVIGEYGVYGRQREVSKRFDVPPGNYVIIPSTFEKNRQKKFFIRVYIEGTSIDQYPSSQNANNRPAIDNKAVSNNNNNIININNNNKNSLNSNDKKPTNNNSGENINNKNYLNNNKPIIKPIKPNPNPTINLNNINPNFNNNNMNNNINNNKINKINSNININTNNRLNNRKDIKPEINNKNSQKININASNNHPNGNVPLNNSKNHSSSLNISPNIPKNQPGSNIPPNGPKNQAGSNMPPIISNDQPGSNTPKIIQNNQPLNDDHNNNNSNNLPQKNLNNFPNSDSNNHNLNTNLNNEIPSSINNNQNPDPGFGSQQYPDPNNYQEYPDPDNKYSINFNNYGLGNNGSYEFVNTGNNYEEFYNSQNNNNKNDNNSFNNQRQNSGNRRQNNYQNSNKGHHNMNIDATDVINGGMKLLNTGSEIVNVSKACSVM